MQLQLENKPWSPSTGGLLPELPMSKSYIQPGETGLFNADKTWCLDVGHREGGGGWSLALAAGMDGCVYWGGRQITGTKQSRGHLWVVQVQGEELEALGESGCETSEDKGLSLTGKWALLKIFRGLWKTHKALTMMVTPMKTRMWLIST